MIRLEEKFNKYYESLLLEYNQKQIDKFKDKFGDDNFNWFIKNGDRLKKNAWTTDIDFYLSNKFSNDDFTNLVQSFENNLDDERKPIPEPSNTKKLIYSKDNINIYWVTDVEDMIDLSDIKYGDIIPNWCISGRYDQDEYSHRRKKPKVSQAISEFSHYKQRYNLDGYYVVIDNNEYTFKGKFCILIDKNNNLIQIFDGNDRALNSLDEMNSLHDYSDVIKYLNLHELYTYYYKQNNELTEDAKKLMKRVIVSKDVKVLKANSIVDFTNDIDLIIENGVEKIEDDAIYDCIINNLYLPNSLKYMGKNFVNGYYLGCNDINNIYYNKGSYAEKYCTLTEPYKYIDQDYIVDR